MSLFRSDHPAQIDWLRSDHAPVWLKSLSICGFTLLTVLGAKIEIHAGEVPTTLQTLSVYGSGLFLGPAGALLAQLLYLTLGLFLPVTAGDGVGLAYITSRVSSGYLLAFPLVATLIGLLSQRWNSLLGALLSLELGSVLLFVCGVTWLHAAIPDYAFSQAVSDGWLQFLPADVTKIVFVAAVYVLLRRATAQPDGGH